MMTKTKEDNGQCRSYSFVGTNMIQKFKDQFEVFTSLPFVDSLKQELHGTIVRIAYRHAVNVDEEEEEKKEDEKPWNRTYTSKDLLRLQHAFQDTVRHSLLFTTTLTRIVMSSWDENTKLPAMLSRCTVKNVSPELQKKRAKVSQST